MPTRFGIPPRGLGITLAGKVIGLFLEWDGSSCYLESGILTSFFSGLTGRALTAVQISCEYMGSDLNRFVLELSDRFPWRGS